MRIAVLSSTDSWYWRDLQRAAGDRHELKCVAFPNIHAALGDVAADPIAAGSENLTAFDAVLVRTMPPGSLEQVVFRMNALAQVEQRGTIVLNPARSLEVAVDKYLTLAKLAAEGMHIPATVTCQSWCQGMEAFELLGGDVVVKPVFGGEGRGITRVDDPAIALRVFKTLEQLGAVIYLQKYIAHQGCDVRLLVIGNHVLGMRRCNATDWRTNVSRGASTLPLAVDDSLRDMALVAARAVGCPLAAVDLLPASDGHMYVLEVNAVPGWKALARTLRLDVARLVLELAEQRVEGGESRNHKSEIRNQKSETARRGNRDGHTGDDVL